MCNLIRNTTFDSLRLMSSYFGVDSINKEWLTTALVSPVSTLKMYDVTIAHYAALIRIEKFSTCLYGKISVMKCLWHPPTSAQIHMLKL